MRYSIVGFALLAAMCAEAQTTASKPPGASSPKQALLNYLTGLEGQSGKHILIGQHTDYWSADPTHVIAGVQRQTGKLPAIVGLYFDMGNFSKEGMPADRYYGVTLANQYLAAGQIVLISEGPLPPVAACPAMWAGNTGAGVTACAEAAKATLPAADFASMTKPGTTEYRNYQTYLARLAATLKQINGPVLFRPFYEMNGNWFWWGHGEASQFIAVWRMMHDYLAAAGVSNLLWVYAPNGGNGNYAAYYPGSEYVDIVGLDAYPPGSADASAWEVLRPLGKPMIYAEMGSQPTQAAIAAQSVDDSALLSAIEQNAPRAVAIMFWCQTSALDMQKGAAAVMHDPQVITLSDLPKRFQ